MKSVTMRNEYSKNNYRIEINGLRGIAVLGVLIYHFFPAFMPSGFLGVDVFFVISGYLITFIISNETNNNNFRLRAFYLRRFNRIAPALIVTILITLLCSIFFLSPQSLHDLANASSFSLLTSANIYYWLTINYFSKDVFEYPLLHLWSLAVEVQFYLIYPFLLKPILKNNLFKIRFFILSILVLTATTALINSYYPQLVFYWMPFRLFEFLTGAFGFFIFKEGFRFTKLSGSMVYAGLLLIISAYFIDANSIFNFAPQIIVTIGALICLISVPNQEHKNPLKFKHLVNLGIISYSVYLCHWPILSIYKNHSEVQLSIFISFLLILLTFAISIVMYFLIETKYRNPNMPQAESKIPTIKVFTTLAIGTLALSSAISYFDGLYSFKQHDFEFQLNSEREMQKRYILSKKACQLSEVEHSRFCKMTKKKQILVIGNSHEVDGYNIIKQISSDEHVNIIAFGTLNKCYSETKNDLSSDKCLDKFKLLKSLKFISNIDLIVYSSNKPFNNNKVHTFKLIDELMQLNTSMKLLVIGGYINTKPWCSEIYYKTSDLNNCKAPKYVTYFPNNVQSLPKYKLFSQLSFIYLDKVELLCENRLLTNCIVNTEGNVPFTYDSNHLSFEFSELIASKIKTNRLDIINLVNGIK